MQMMPRPSQIENAPPPPRAPMPRPSQIENAPPPPRAPAAALLPGVTVYESSVAPASLFPGGQDDDDDVTCRGIIRMVAKGPSLSSVDEGAAPGGAPLGGGGFRIFQD